MKFKINKSGYLSIDRDIIDTGYVISECPFGHDFCGIHCSLFGSPKTEAAAFGGNWIVRLPLCNGVVLEGELMLKEETDAE